MDVGVWLGNLGLGQYEAAFRDNEIDGAVLPKLTLDDLKDLGVAVVGHRRKIMSAIEELNIASVACATAMKPRKTQAPSSVVAGSDGAERRPITVMFCDLVGSTSLAARLDAEDWRNLVGAYLDEACTAVTGLGGHVLKKLGDGLMALFGYPQAQENDAERAVRAALAIQRALADLNARNVRSGAPELSARIGIECGSVVVDAAGEVFGEAPNVAARVQAAAEPGTVLVTASVQRQTAGLFEDVSPSVRSKVFAQPVVIICTMDFWGGIAGISAILPHVALDARHWIVACVGFDQCVQIIEQTGVRFGQRFASPPGRRTRAGVDLGGRSSSFTPRPIVLAAMRVTRETATMPPCPAARASEAAKIRRCRSSNRGDIATWRISSFRKESSSIVTLRYDDPLLRAGRNDSQNCPGSESII